MREEAEAGWGNGRNSVGEYERNFTESASGGIKNINLNMPCGSIIRL